MADQIAAMLVQSALVTIAALMPIVNPIGSAPIFLSMSADLPNVGRHRLARSVAWNAFLLLMASMLVGSHVLAFFGISLPIVRVGGGLLVTASGWRMLNAEDTRGKPTPKVSRRVGARDGAPRVLSADVPAHRRPGSISIAITLGARVPGRGSVRPDQRHHRPRGRRRSCR